MTVVSALIPRLFSTFKSKMAGQGGRTQGLKVAVKLRIRKEQSDKQNFKGYLKYSVRDVTGYIPVNFVSFNMKEDRLMCKTRYR